MAILVIPCVINGGGVEDSLMIQYMLLYDVVDFHGYFIYDWNGKKFNNRLKFVFINFRLSNLKRDTEFYLE